MITFRYVVLASILLVAACSEPPRGRGPADDPAPEPASSPAVDEDGRYDFENEGEFPETPGDVAFEEDELPPRPEDVEGGELQDDPVVSEDVQDSEALPDPDGQERIEPTVTAPVAPAVTTPVPQGSAVRVVRGFRVQLLAVAELARANTLAAEASQRLGVPVHVVAESQVFKVRAGDFTDRADAVRLKERATSMGYDGSWVVTDEVQLKD